VQQLSKVGLDNVLTSARISEGNRERHPVPTELVYFDHFLSRVMDFPGWIFGPLSSARFLSTCHLGLIQWCMRDYIVGSEFDVLLYTVNLVVFSNVDE
jgi:hypothetical protein